MLWTCLWQKVTAGVSLDTLSGRRQRKVGKSILKFLSFPPRPNCETLTSGFVPSFLYVIIASKLKTAEYIEDVVHKLRFFASQSKAVQVERH